MKIMEDIRKYATKLRIAEGEACQRGIGGKPMEFMARRAGGYAKA